MPSLDERVDSIQCKGLCTECCALIPFPRRLREKYPEYDLPSNPYGVAARLLAGEKNVCFFLIDGRCSIYAERPAICHLFGNTVRMPCPHGCHPDGPLLTRHEGRKYLKSHGEGSL